MLVGAAHVGVEIFTLKHRLMNTTFSGTGKRSQLVYVFMILFLSKHLNARTLQRDPAKTANDT